MSNYNKKRGQRRRASRDEGQPKKKRWSQRLQDNLCRQLIEWRQAIWDHREARLATKKKKYQLLKEEKREREKGQVKKKAIQEGQEDPTEEEQDKVEDNWTEEEEIWEPDY